MVGNTGTYLDTTSHRYADGVDLAGTPLPSLADLPGLVIHVPDDVTAIEALLLAPYDVAGHAVLLHTGWDRHWAPPSTEPVGTPS